MTVDHHKTRGYETIDEDLKFCQLALARGNSLAMQGQLELATRDLRAAEDTADDIKKFLAEAGGEEFLDRWNKQLVEVQRRLNELRSTLDIPPERQLTYHPGRLEPSDSRA